MRRQQKAGQDLDAILATGVEIRLNTRIGDQPGEIPFSDIQKEYDAVYIAIGAHSDKKIGIEGEGSKGVISAVEMLKSIGDGIMPDFKGKRVVVVGGGNVAMDCARSSIRLGAASVCIAYRRRKEDMTALPDEIDGAIAEGAELFELNAPQKIEADAEGNVTAFWTEPQIIGPIDKWGRALPMKADKDPVRIPCDIIVVAIGQGIESKSFENAGIKIHKGAIEAIASGAVEDHEGVFAGGDCVTGPATVIKAISAGAIAARNIDDYLGFNHPIKMEVEVPAAKAGDKAPCGRCNTVERPVHERSDDFDLMEENLSVEEAMQEASRCLRCDHFGYGAFRGGRKQEW